MTNYPIFQAIKDLEQITENLKQTAKDFPAALKGESSYYEINKDLVNKMTATQITLAEKEAEIAELKSEINRLKLELRGAYITREE